MNDALDLAAAESHIRMTGRGRSLDKAASRLRITPQHYLVFVAYQHFHGDRVAYGMARGWRRKLRRLRKQYGLHIAAKSATPRDK